MIDVLLATYRPREAMLREQVDSIRAQRDVEVNLVRREDSEGLGACGNFDALLAESRAEYVAFSDQDDVWDVNKLSKSLAKMRELEATYGRDVPLLVFCDGYVTDANLEPMPGTVLSGQHVDVAKGLCFNRLLMQNFVAGNDMLFNAALREMAGRVPAQALMHDAWIMLVAAAFGHIGFVDEPLYFYRQHGENVLGAARPSRNAHEFRSRLEANVAQAAAFVCRFGPRAPKAALALAGFRGLGWFARRAAIVRHGLWKHGFKRNLALFLLA